MQWFKQKIHRFFIKLLMRFPALLVEALRSWQVAQKTSLSSIPASLLPAKIQGFHDIAFLFSSHQANRGILAQDFDEAAYLWKTIQDRKPSTILEIGRWLGGSTTLLCAAAQAHGGTVISIDLKVKSTELASDLVITNFLNKLGLTNVELHVGSSFTFRPRQKISLAFIDGDHSYEGVKKDFENLLPYLLPGADLLFHDSCATRAFATNHLPVAKLMAEIRLRPDFKLIGEMGSLTHFRLIAL